MRQGKIDPVILVLGCVRHDARTEMLMCLRRGGRGAVGQCFDLSIRLRERRAGRESAEHRDVCAFERRVSFRPQSQGDPHPVIDRERKAFRHDADDGHRGPSELHRLADRVGASAEPLTPHVVAEHHDRRRPGPFVRVEQRPAVERRHPHEAECRRGNLRDRHRPRLHVTTDEVSFDRPVGAELLERWRIPPPGGEVVQHSVFPPARHRVARLDFDETVAVRERHARV